MKSRCGVLMDWRCYFFACSLFILVAPAFSRAGSYPSDIEGVSKIAGDMLEKNRLYYLDRTLPILSTSFVNLDDLKETSTFGRLLGVRVASRFSQHGYRVVELRLSKGSVVIQEKDGEFVLSRETARLEGSHNAQAIILGTYSLGENRIYLSVRLVDIRNNSAISSYDFSMRMDESLKMLTKNKGGCLVPAKKTVQITDLEDDQDKTRGVQKSGGNSISNGSILLKLSNPLAAKIVQAQLSSLGYYKWKIDGIWKSRSKRALSEFKRERNLPNTSRWDLETQLALFNPKL